MRQFQYQPEPPSRTWRTRLQTYWYILMPLFAISVIGILGFSFGVRSIYGNNFAAMEHPSSKASFRELDSDEAKSQFMQRYLKMKRAASLPHTEALRVTGNYSNEHEIRAFVGTLDLQGNASFNLEHVEVQQLDFVDGKLSTDVPPAYTNIALLMQGFVDSLRDPFLAITQSEGSDSVKMEPIVMMGVDAVKVSARSKALQLNTSSIVSASSMAILQREDFPDLTETIKYRYYDHKTVDGVLLPFAVTIQKESGLLNRVTLNSVRSM